MTNFAASGWTISGNALVNAGEDTGFYFSHEGRDNSFTNNVMINSTKGGLVARISGSTSMKPGVNASMFASLYSMPFQRPPWSTRYPRLAALPDNLPAWPKGNKAGCNVAVDMIGRPKVCTGAGYAHNSPNECINRDGYLSLQVEMYNDTSCFNISSPSLATNLSALTFFVSQDPAKQLIFRLRPEAAAALPCFRPLPTEWGPRQLKDGPPSMEWASRAAVMVQRVGPPGRKSDDDDEAVGSDGGRTTTHRTTAAKHAGGRDSSRNGSPGVTLSAVKDNVVTINNGIVSAELNVLNATVTKYSFGGVNLLETSLTAYDIYEKNAGHVGMYFSSNRADGAVSVPIPPLCLALCHSADALTLNVS